MAGTPKDHYVPQLYLDAFAIEGARQENPHIFQYMEGKIVSPRISDVASEKHFYTFTEKESGKKSREIDNVLKMSEDPSAEPIRKIIENGNLDLTDDERAALSIFFAMLIVRTPGFIKTLKSIAGEALKEMQALRAMHPSSFKKDLAEAGVELTEEEFEKQRKFVIEKKYHVDFSNDAYFLGQGLSVSRDLAEWYYQNKAWHLLISDSEKVFVTSDNPVSIYRPNFGNPMMNGGNKHGTLFIPISPKHALLLRDAPYKSEVLRVSRGRVASLNENTMRFSDKYIFSNLSSKQIADQYVRVGKAEFQQINTKRHKFAPFVFFTPPPIPDEPSF